MITAQEYYAPQELWSGTTVVEIAVPSGKLIASDDLRMGPFDIEPQQSINYGIGADAYSRLFAETRNIAYASVGNTCPQITKNAEGLLQVISPYWSEETGVVFEEGEETVAKICTDHWATMLTDYEFWLACGGKTIEEANKEFKVQSFYLIDVTPGKYRWTVNSHSDFFDVDALDRAVFAKLELIEAYKISATDSLN
jgi:hypothetical protein